MSFTVQEIKERDAALIVLESEPPSDRWFRMWEDWFAKQAGDARMNRYRIVYIADGREVVGHAEAGSLAVAWALARNHAEACSESLSNPIRVESVQYVGPALPTFTYHRDAFGGYLMNDEVAE